MTRREFYDYAKDVERLCRGNPSEFQRYFLLFALLSYGWLILVFGFLGCFLVGLPLVAAWGFNGIPEIFTVEFVVFALFSLGLIACQIWSIKMGAIIVGGFWSIPAPPHSREITENEAPRLFEMIAELRKEMGVRGLDKILISREFDSKADFAVELYQNFPRLEMLGISKPQLIIGIGVFAIYSSSEMKAIIAHELGHLSDSSILTWASLFNYNFIQIWTELEMKSELGKFLFAGFRNTVQPRLLAYILAAKREAEWRADRHSVAFAGLENARTCHKKQCVAYSFVQENYYREIRKTLLISPDPPPNFYTRLFAFLAAGIPQIAAEKYFHRAWLQKTSIDDVHPGLADRLSEMLLDNRRDSALLNSPYTAEMEKHTRKSTPSGRIYAIRGRYETDSSATSLLYPVFPELIREYDDGFCYNKCVDWREFHESAKQFAPIEEKEDPGDLPLNEALDCAKMMLYLGFENAQHFVKSLAVKYPKDGDVNLLAAGIAFEKEDLAGLSYLEKSMSADVMHFLLGCDLAVSFFRSTGKNEEAEYYIRRKDEMMQSFLYHQSEIYSCRNDNTFISHDLDDSQVKNLREFFSAFSQIKSVFLVRKLITEFPMPPIFVIGFITDYEWYSVWGNIENLYLCRRISSDSKFPKNTILVNLSMIMNRELYEKFRVVPNAKIL